MENALFVGVDESFPTTLVNASLSHAYVILQGTKRQVTVR